MTYCRLEPGTAVALVVYALPLTLTDLARLTAVFTGLVSVKTARPRSPVVPRAATEYGAGVREGTVKVAPKTPVPPTVTIAGLVATSVLL
jgi:hypothetical protein